MTGTHKVTERAIDRQRGIADDCEREEDGKEEKKARVWIKRSNKSKQVQVEGGREGGRARARARAREWEWEWEGLSLRFDRYLFLGVLGLLVCVCGILAVFRWAALLLVLRILLVLSGPGSGFWFLVSGFWFLVLYLQYCFYSNRPRMYQYYM